MLEWFDSQPTRYWTLAWSCFTLLVVVGIGPVLAGFGGEKFEAATRRFWPRWLFLLVLAATFLAFRWPLFFVGEELNPDESQLIAGGITLQSDPIYWRSVDGSTHGPLDTYPLLAVRLVGLPINYGTARLTGSVLLLAAIALTYLALARYYGEALGRLGCLPAFCFFAFSTFWDFVHYSSEHAPLFLDALGATLLSLALLGALERRASFWCWLGGGLALGAVPLAKLQGAPIAAALLVTASLINLCSTETDLKTRLRRVGVLAAGTAAVPLLFTVVTLIYGQQEHAWRSYIVQNLRYAGDHHYTHAEMLRRFWEFADIGSGFYAFAAGAAAFMAATLMRSFAFPAATLRLLALSGAFLLSSLVAVLTPGRQYTHYLIFLIMPATLFAGCLLAGWWQLAGKTGTASLIQRGVLLLAFTGLMLWPQVESRASHPHPYLGKLTAYATAPAAPVVQEILRYARAGESLGQWGWMCRYYVLTGMRQSNRTAHTAAEIQASAQIDYYRARYMTDLQRNRPPVFIDTVGPGNFTFQDRAALGHETFPALRDYIDLHYGLVADVDGTRIYVRNDRLGKP